MVRTGPGAGVPVYLADLDDTGAMTDLRIVPMQARRMRLEHAGEDDCAWLRTTLDRVSQGFGTRIVSRGRRELAVEPG